MVCDGTRLVLVGLGEDLQIPLEDFEDRMVLGVSEMGMRRSVLGTYLDNSMVPNLGCRMAFHSTTH